MQRRIFESVGKIRLRVGLLIIAVGCLIESFGLRVLSERALEESLREWYREAFGEEPPIQSEMPFAWPEEEIVGGGAWPEEVDKEVVPMSKCCNPKEPRRLRPKADWGNSYRVDPEDLEDEMD